MTTTVSDVHTHYPMPKPAIKAWHEDDRPREKLMLKGRHNMTDAELLAILLGSGSQRETALDLARRILHAVDNNLNELGKKNHADLMAFHGVGEAKAVTLIAAMELGRRRQLVPVTDRPKITSSRDAYDCLSPLMAELEHEECWMLCLNRANYVIQRIQVSSGGRSSTIVDAKVIFGRALEARACGIVVAHNHPSTSLRPSKADIDVTRKLAAVGKAMDLMLLDHLIISDRGYYSFKDESDVLD